MKTYLVGGAVRDELLGIQPKDRDYVVVGATPADMLALGYSQVGADFPVFLHPETKEEYALARVERKTGAGYHGFEVRTDNVRIEDDLYRRDLTINSIAKDGETGEIVDPWGGVSDLEKRILRHTSEAFEEDPLRVIRLARFAARYPEFTIHDETMKLCERIVDANALDELPNERFWAELYKAFESHNFWLFIQTLLHTRALRATRFFGTMFQGVNYNKIRDAAQVCQQFKHGLDAFVAFIAPYEENIKELGGSNTIQTMKKNLHRFEHTDDTQGMLDLLNGLRVTHAFSNMNVHLLKETIVLALACRSQFHYSLSHLTMAIQAVKRISAKDLPANVKGKEIVQELDRRRYEALHEILVGY
jgi:tRNA nucleotidyltransferase/poly(A) polymerase